MSLLIKIIITAALVLLISNFMPGVHVESFTTALFVAIVLGLLNVFIKPIIGNFYVASYNFDIRIVSISCQCNNYTIM